MDTKKSSNPLVYHLLGDIEHPESMVLTEKDYIDFVIYLNKEREQTVLPLEIRKYVNWLELLFVGYSLYDISFSVIFQTIINSQRANRKLGISVQLMSTTTSDNIDEINLDKAQKYLEKYTEKMFKLYIYPGSVLKFSEELRYQLDNFKG